MIQGKKKNLFIFPFMSIFKSGLAAYEWTS